MERQPKFRICRRVGSAIFSKCQSPKFSSSQFPGRNEGGSGKRRRALSEFGTQLTEKQKLKYTYGISEEQLKNYVKMAQSIKGNAAANLQRLLELRVDNAVFRGGLASTRTMARQMVSHGHIVLNGTRITRPSTQVKVGDEITVRKGSLNTKLWTPVEGKEVKKVERTKGWIVADDEKKIVTIKGVPAAEETDAILNVGAVVEFYSRV